MTTIKTVAAFALLTVLAWVYSIVASWREDALLLPVAERAAVDAAQQLVLLKSDPHCPKE